MGAELASSGTEIARVSVVGAGTMGYGIALTFALGGKSVVLFDIDETALKTAAENIHETVDTLHAHGELTQTETEAVRARISYESSLETAIQDADLVTEAVSEDMELKQTVFAKLGTHAPEEAILATNTSGLSITEIASVVDNQSRVVGTHYFNPPYIVPVVELVKGTETADSTVTTLAALFETIDKTPVVVERDIPGFIVNRIQTAMAYEAESLLNSGVASAEDIDRAVKGSLGFRLPILGIFEKSDHSGLDVHHDVISHLLPHLDRGTEPHEFLTELVTAGNYGVKTGQGVYNWEGEDMDSVYAARDESLFAQLAVYRDSLTETK
ncbi:3-hydroxyacyl-CoA dehydrogenase family protein [Haladaptatus sp. CMSO5]|uniref:3-hydroxyacyl-CoA dehydrogenase family protein n=1 Tax=Haladaptatus sp. CMSO5 TaxID=3120514 RepID=UPI002FCE21E3